MVNSRLNVEISIEKLHFKITDLLLCLYFLRQNGRVQLSWTTSLMWIFFLMSCRLTGKCFLKLCTGAFLVHFSVLAAYALLGGICAQILGNSRLNHFLVFSILEKKIFPLLLERIHRCLIDPLYIFSSFSSRALLNRCHKFYG